MKNDDNKIIELVTKDIKDIIFKELLIISCVSFYNDVVKKSSTLKSYYLKGRNVVVEHLALTMINDISLEQYCECLKYTEEINCSDGVKSGARKFLLLLYKNIIESDVNLNNVHDLKQDGELLTWNIRTRTLIEIIDGIFSIHDFELRTLIKIYVKSICRDECKSDVCRAQIRLHVSALKLSLIWLENTKIVDISWKHYCKIMKSIRENKDAKSRIRMRKILYDIYNIVLNDHKYKNQELTYLRKNRKFIKEKELSGDSGCGDNEFMMDNIMTFFPINSKIETLYLYRGSEKNKDSIDYRYVILNLNTSNKFLTYILGTYIESHGPYGKFIYEKVKIFLYYFEMSFGNCVPCKIEDINIETYREQYLYCCLLQERYMRGEFNNDNRIIKKNIMFSYILRDFYFFILSYIKVNKIQHNIFVGTNITENIFTANKFNLYFSNHYEFVKLSPIDLSVPRFKKWAVIPDGIIGCGTWSNGIIGIDFTKLSDQSYIEVVQNFYWKGNRNNVTTTVLKKNSFLIDFLNYKYKFDLKIRYIADHSDITINFDGRFLSNYVVYIKARYSNEDTRYSAFGVVKAFLKYLNTVKKNDGKYKYSIDQLGMKALKTKMNKDKGGNPIPINILNLILNELEKKRDNSDEAELIYIVIYIMINSKLRIGEILNLQRGCINNKRPGFIKYISKTSYGEFIEELFTTEVLEMIANSKNITDKYVENADERLKKYIYIVSDKSVKKRVRIKKLSMGVNHEIKNIIKALVKSGDIDESIKDDILKHSCYDIRATRIDSLYKKGIEEGLPLLQIFTMAGNSIQVGMSHYVQRMKKMNLIEIFAGVRIANVNIKGEILETDEELDIKIKYKDDYGGCNNMKCRGKVKEEDYSFACLLCKQFTTCKSRADVFKLKVIELKIRRDKEVENKSQYAIDFINKKIELYTVYLAKMLYQKGEI